MTGKAVEPVSPLVAQAQRRGTITARHARVIVKTIETLPDVVRDEHAESAEQTLVDNGTFVCGHDHRERIRQGWAAQLINGRVGWRPPAWIDPTREPRYNTLYRPLLT